MFQGFLANMIQGCLPITFQESLLIMFLGVSLSYSKGSTYYGPRMSPYRVPRMSPYRIPKGLPIMFLRVSLSCSFYYFTNPIIFQGCLLIMVQVRLPIMVQWVSLSCYQGSAYHVPRMEHDGQIPIMV